MMKRALAFLTALLLALPLLAQLPAIPARAETPASAVITLKRSFGESPAVTVSDPAFLRWLQSLLTVDAPCEPLETRPANSVYTVTFNDAPESTDEPDCWVTRSVTFTIVHDDLYNRAAVTLPDGSVHSISVNVPEMLNRAVFERLSFDIPESHRSLLQRSGWTVAFRHPHMLVQLPRTLEASRTDASALHFTWADLFLRDAGYDVTPWLGRAAIPYVYSLYETMPRSAFYTNDASDVRCSMYAVVLECDGQIIGAYLFAYSLDGSNLMSLKGNAAPALLGGQSVRDYLLARLPMTGQERELAALTPEEIIIRYGMINDPMLTDVGVLLQNLGSGSSQLFSPLALMPIPRGQTVTVTGKVWEDDLVSYEIEMPQGLRFPQIIYESPETGWKVVHFYNTGY